VSHAISVGDYPIGVAVNPATNTVYAATVSTVAPNYGSGALAVINGTTNTLVATVPIGDLPVGVAVNAATNTVYVPRQGGFLTVIDGATNTIAATVPLHYNPGGPIAVNPATNTVYVSTNEVAVIDGATNTVTTNIPVGWWTNEVGVDPTTNAVYVTNVYDSLVSNDWEIFLSRMSVIDGTTKAVSANVDVPYGVGAGNVGHSRARVRRVTATRTPCSASFKAMPRPIPRELPVTSAHLQ
jgi:DNA-binding beta-propeller fold protein YncE